MIYAWLVHKKYSEKVHTINTHFFLTTFPIISLMWSHNHVGNHKEARIWQGDSYESISIRNRNGRTNSIRSRFQREDYDLL